MCVVGTTWREGIWGTTPGRAADRCPRLRVWLGSAPPPERGAAATPDFAELAGPTVVYPEGGGPHVLPAPVSPALRPCLRRARRGRRSGRAHQILYDNTAATRGLKAAWGFAALVEAHGRTVLFDTGGDPAVLRDNLAVLRVDASRIQAVVISHFHGDHTEGTGGLAAPKGTNVYTPHSFAPYGQTMAALTAAGLVPVAVEESRSLFDGIAIAAPMQFPSRKRSATGVVSIDEAWEQALLVDTPRGLVVVVGCAHPGIVPMLEQVKKTTGKPIHLVLGGFHLPETPLTEARAIASAVKSLGVALAGPTHCTGDTGILAFREVFGDAFVPGGVGQVIEVAAAPASSPPRPPSARRG